MPEPGSTTRRGFLVTVASVGGVAMVVLRRGTGRPDDARELVLQLSDLVGGHADVSMLGREYLAATPDEADIDRLVGHLAPAFGPPAWPLDAARAAARFRTRVADDFAGGDVVEVRGWLLSRTELRLCALVALRPWSGHA